ncbi:MAG: hypothetical protein ACTMIY_09985 [Microbacterium gubbeenense]
MRDRVIPATIAAPTEKCAPRISGNAVGFFVIAFPRASLSLSVRISAVRFQADPLDRSPRDEAV